MFRGLWCLGVPLQGEIAVLAEQPRLATVTAVGPTTLLELDKASFLAVFAGESSEALADFELRLIRHNAELRHVIRHPIGRRYFTEALKKEFSQENIEVLPVHAARAAFGPLWLNAPDVAAPALMQFWRKADEFRLWAIPHDEDAAPCPDVVAAAKALYTEFISDASTHQINISSKNRAAVEAVRRSLFFFIAFMSVTDPLWGFRFAQVLNSGNVRSDALACAQNEIYLLMEKDNFPRFKRSDLFKQLLREIDPHSVRLQHCTVLTASAPVASRLCVCVCV